MIVLETDRLILRDYMTEDAEMYYRLKSNDKVMYYLQHIKTDSFVESNNEFQNVLQDISSENRKMYFFHTELRDTHEQVGSIGYTVTDTTPVGKMVHLGYFTYPKFWNRGYVSEALNRVIQFAFEENHVYRITTGCLKENTGSERVMIRCGLIKEAEHKDWEWHDGKIKTRLEYRLLRREWNRANIGGCVHE